MLRWDTPSIFVGNKGTKADIHIDGLASNFWMYLAQGQKRWVMYHPEDSAGLSLEELEGNEDVRRVEFILKEGEVLYVPHLSPHHVENLSVTVAVT